jgi:hypothetical protein
MEPSSIIIIIIVGVVLLLVFYVIGVYNKLINARNKVKDQFAQIDVQLKRRSDMIPNLVETVKGYACSFKINCGTHTGYSCSYYYYFVFFHNFLLI